MPQVHSGSCAHPLVRSNSYYRVVATTSGATQTSQGFQPVSTAAGTSSSPCMPTSKGCQMNKSANQGSCHTGVSNASPGNNFVYPAPYGSNVTGCGTWASPCSTIQQGILNTAYAGATLWAGPGAERPPSRGSPCTTRILWVMLQGWARGAVAGLYTGTGNAGLTFNGQAMYLVSLCGQGVTLIHAYYSSNIFLFSTETVHTTVTGAPW